MLDTLKLFHSLGLHDGEVFYSREQTIVYEYVTKTLKVKNIRINEGFGIRILKNKKLGFSYTNSKADMQKAIKNAISLSKFSQPSNFSFAQKQKYPNVEGYDRKVAQIEENELKDIIYEIAEGVEKYSKPVRIVLVVQKGESAIANTNLLFAREKSTSFMAFAEAKNGNGFGISDYSHYRIPKNPKKLGERAGLMAKEMNNPKKLPSGKYSVIFSPEILSSLFDLLSFSFSSELKRRKISKLWDKEGKRIFDEKLTVYDDPFADAGGKEAYDGEGVASRKTTLIEKGVVRNFYYNREAAAFENIEKEGNCSRAGYQYSPGLGASNTVIEKGNGNPEEEIKKYVYIESMHGLHTANQITGDFGAEANIAFLMENGKKTPVRGFMASENIFNLFSKIECMGKAQMQSGEFISPAIAFRDVSLIS